MRVKGKNLEAAADDATRNNMAGGSKGTAMRDILVGIAELVDTDISDNKTYDTCYSN